MIASSTRHFIAFEHLACDETADFSLIQVNGSADHVAALGRLLS